VKGDDHVSTYRDESNGESFPGEGSGKIKEKPKTQEGGSELKRT
jgi:hypothetical protein